jgi:hypothetical protein
MTIQSIGNFSAAGKATSASKLKDDMIPILRGGGDWQGEAIDTLPIGLLSSGMMAQQRHSLLQNSGKLLSHGSRKENRLHRA